jgi:polyisoprenyl-phosphate glycosyltransferase
MKIISIVVPCYNEALNLPLLHERLRKTFSKLPRYEYEILFVDNVSTDNSRNVYERIIEQDSKVKVLLMARNYGTSQTSFLAGLRHAKGDATVLIESDLQDPPELIEAFVKKWEEGFDVVYGIRTKRKGSILRRIFYTLFYRIFKWISYLPIPLDAGDFSLLDKKVVDIIASLPEKDVYIRGLRSWAGFKQTGIPYIRDDRAHGKTSIQFFKNFEWAKKAIVNFSDKPLSFISRIALASTFFTFCAAIYYLYIHMTTATPKGFSTLLMFIFIFGSLQLLCLGVIGEYLIRLFHEVKNRPPYIIKEILEKKKDQSNG